MSNTTDIAIIQRAMQLHIWRTYSYTVMLADWAAKVGEPFCWECGDWHSYSKEHSTTTTA